VEQRCLLAATAQNIQWAGEISDANWLDFTGRVKSQPFMKGHGFLF